MELQLNSSLSSTTLFSLHRGLTRHRQSQLRKRHGKMAEGSGHVRRGVPGAVCCPLRTTTAHTAPLGPGTKRKRAADYHTCSQITARPLRMPQAHRPRSSPHLPSHPIPPSSQSHIHGRGSDAGMRWPSVGANWGTPRVCPCHLPCRTSCRTSRVGAWVPRRAVAPRRPPSPRASPAGTRVPRA